MLYSYTTLNSDIWVNALIHTTQLKHASQCTRTQCIYIAHFELNLRFYSLYRHVHVYWLWACIKHLILLPVNIWHFLSHNCHAITCTYRSNKAWPMRYHNRRKWAVRWDVNCYHEVSSGRWRWPIGTSSFQPSRDSPTWTVSSATPYQGPHQLSGLTIDEQQIYVCTCTMKNRFKTRQNVLCTIN